MPPDLRPHGDILSITTNRSLLTAEKFHSFDKIWRIIQEEEAKYSLTNPLVENVSSFTGFLQPTLFYGTLHEKVQSFIGRVIINVATQVRARNLLQ